MFVSKTAHVRSPWLRMKEFGRHWAPLETDLAKESLFKNMEIYMIAVNAILGPWSQLSVYMCMARGLESYYCAVCCSGVQITLPRTFSCS